MSNEKFPDSILRVIRTGYPNSIKDEIISEFPMTERKMSLKKKFFIGFRKEGGVYHDFLKGWNKSPKKIYFKISLVHKRMVSDLIYHLETERVFIKIKLYEEKHV